MPRAKRNFSPQFREEAVKLVIEGSRPIAAVARELGIGDGTLGNWVAAYRREHAGDEPTLNISERERLRHLEREARELRMENEFLKKAALDSKGQGNALGWGAEAEAFAGPVVQPCGQGVQVGLVV